jgi:hypothetical protein
VFYLYSEHYKSTCQVQAENAHAPSHTHISKWNHFRNINQVSAGFPQGSILGPLLFILFINDVFQLMLPGVELFLYADDTAIIFSAPDNAILQHNATDFFVQYVHWCAANCIVVNQLNLITYCLMILMQ